MHTTIPFCERCGRVGSRLSGSRQVDDGLERWTLFACGHVTVELVPNEAPARTMSVAG